MIQNGIILKRNTWRFIKINCDMIRVYLDYNVLAIRKRAFNHSLRKCQE
jgi:hypothetical protein